MLRWLKSCLLIVLVILLSSCSSRLSPDRSKAEQEQVKQQVMQLLEQEYQQPFQLESFKYEYKTHYEYSFMYVHGKTYGTFYFTVKAVDNPIVVDSFIVYDDKKESINDLIDSFKKNQLMNIYCDGFTSYYSDVVNKGQPLVQPSTKQTEKYCDNLDQTGYRIYKDYYMQNMATEHEH